MEIFGREREQNQLRLSLDSGMPELVAVYGRRRVGKTYLIRRYFNDKFDFYLTGVYQGTKKEQLQNFQKQLNHYADASFPLTDNWFDAFDQLKTYLQHLNKKRVIVFIDEMPWLDTPKSRFLKAFELFWNSWGATQEKLMFIVCGSATTWMMNKLIGDKGGLHNRTSRNIHLSPFNLYETEAYLRSRKIRLSHLQIAECYMILGGVPYYLSLLETDKSLSQNIDNLFFHKDGVMKNEYYFLLRSLFNEASLYSRIIELISSKNKGLTQKEIKESLRISDSGKLTEVLNNLVACDMVNRYSAFGKTSRDNIYQISDPFIHFYLTFAKNYNGKDEHRWTNMLDNPTRTAWSGYAFELICLLHLNQIKQRLGIAGILTQTCSWINADTSSRQQIDLVIDRRDQVVNLCEIKYSRAKYEITKKYSDYMVERLEAFRQQTKTRKALHLTMITTSGLADNEYAGEIQSVVDLDDLFRPSI
ncbi:MAG: AAA family ATPase [Paludibacteraceae bacterium]|nr:AAA family ATPase [Paludibacteraceae bacterium]